MNLSWTMWQSALAETLLHFLWQATIVAALVAVLLWLMTRRSPQQRYGVGLLGLLAMAVCPPTTLWVLAAAMAGRDGPADSEIVTQHIGEDSLILSQGQILTFTDKTKPALIVTALASETIAPESPSAVEPYQHWVVVVWSVGVLLFSCRLLIGMVGLYRWTRLRSPLPVELTVLVSRLANSLAMRMPRVFVSPKVPEALALGILRPMILVPTTWLTELPMPMLEAVLAHELAHLRRYDLWINLLQRLLETLFFYQPALWWLSARVRFEREQCCDAVAVKLTKDCFTYAQTLEHVARLGVGTPRSGWATAIGGNRMNLIRRVERVLGITPTRPKARPWLAGLLALAVPSVILWVTLMPNSPTSQAEAAADEPAVKANQDADEVAGIVVDDRGNRVPGVKIDAYSYTKVETIRQFEADAQGNFKVPKSWWSQQDHITLIAKEENRIGWFAFFGRPERASDNLDVRMVMVPTEWKVQGELLDEKDRPLPELPVGLEFLTHKDNGWLYAAHFPSQFSPVRTDRAGRFGMNLPATWMDLRLRDPDRLALRFVIAEKDKTDLGKITVRRAGRISGRVVDANTGKPVPGTAVRVHYQGRDQAAFQTAGGGDAWTDTDGRFVIGGLFAGPYSAYFLDNPKKLVAPAQEGVMVEVGKTTPVEFQVNEGRRLTGKVVDVKTGKPLPDFEVRYHGPAHPRWGAVHRNVKTDGQGRFELVVSPGATYVYVMEGQFLQIPDSSRRVEVLPDRDFEGLILQASQKTPENAPLITPIPAMPIPWSKLQAELSHLQLHLRTSDNRPVKNANLYMLRDGHLQIGGGWFVGNRHEIPFTKDMFNEVMSFWIDADGFTPVLSKELQIRKQMEPVVVELLPAVYVPVRGRFLNADGKPVAGARARAGRFVTKHHPEFPWGVEALTDADGNYELKRLRMGETLFVYLDKEGVGSVKSERFTLEKKDAHHLPDLRIPRANQILEGVLRDQDQLPVPHAMVHGVTALPDGRDAASARSTKANAEGRFRLEGLLPGKIWLQVEAPGYQMPYGWAIETTSNTKNLNVFLRRLPKPNELPQTLKIELRPKDRRTVAHSDYWFMPEGEPFELSAGWQGNQVVINLENARPKKGKAYQVVVTSQGYSQPKPITVIAGRTNEPVVVELVPAMAVALRGRVVDDQGQPMAGVNVGLSRTLAGKVTNEPWRFRAPPLSVPPPPLPQLGDDSWRSLLPTRDPEVAVTDSDGRFTIPDLAPGCEVAVYVNKLGYTGAWSPRVTLASGKDTVLKDLVLAKSERTIRGLVVNTKGEPVAAARVTAQVFDRGSDGAAAAVNVTALTNADGAFELANAPHGHLYIAVRARDHYAVFPAVNANEDQLRVTVREQE